MIPLRTKLLIILLLVAGDLFSQDLYRYENSVKFGEYLYHTNQFEFAAREFERCVFLKPEDQFSILYLFKTYRKMGEFNKAQNIPNFNNFAETDAAFGLEYVKLLIQTNRYDDAGSFISQNDYFNEKTDLKLSIYLLRKDWKAAVIFRDENQMRIDKSLSEIVDKSLLIKRKSPALAGIFSAVIPGSGKVYAGRWSDGLVSFLMTTSAAFVASRGIMKNKSNFYPWAIGTLSMVYYTGNIFGSVKLAKKINKNKEDELVNQVRDFVLGD